ncbi:NADP-dependent malic enzyme [Candidatus Woesearchaeota archaeon]|nr:NADP-dependent malic enzyme [Candidatus Woesearchaeota archaeon]
MDIYQESLQLHAKLGGKISTISKYPVKDKHDLSLIYTPGVAEACKAIAEDKSKVYGLTIKKNTVAIVSDGSAVLGLGNIGAEAGLPVMEGKAILFKTFAGIDAFPVCISTQNTEEIISIVKNIAVNFAGINLEDISAPRCFEIEERLQEIGIPVFHDDQHGTAVIVLAALYNSLKLTGKKISEIKIVINGAGAAGTAITKLLSLPAPAEFRSHFDLPVKEIIVCDSQGIISKDRLDLNEPKKLLLKLTNPKNISGGLSEALRTADVFIGVSKGNILTEKMIKSMADKPIIFALANPQPEVLPDDAKKWGACIIGTGRSDFPNQINNALAFPGIFRGAIDARAKKITLGMKLAASLALSRHVNPTIDTVIPSIFDRGVADSIALAVKEAAGKE